MSGIDLIAKERQRQIEEEGWTPEHDDDHRYGSLAVVAATLACDGTDARVIDPLERGTDDDPWGLLSKHGYQAGGDDIRKLSIAGALIAAEIDRLERDSAKSASTPSHRVFSS
jgi:hypothetical protein